MPIGEMTTCGTVGQRIAADALAEALAKRSPLILLFGETGVGKSTLLTRFLSTVDPSEFAVVQLSATHGEFIGPPNFDVLLEAICRHLVGPQPTGQRPATLAVLAHAVAALGRAGRTPVIALDHADHLRDEVIAEVAKLAKHLDAPPASLVCLFIGSSALASRLDRVLRRPGSPEKVTEIRVSQPSAEELAALLAYEDTAQPGGPMLTPGAIDRITVYAKSNLHWAVPLAYAARTLALAQGTREVTPELVRGALLELWGPDQQPGESPPAYTFDDGSMTTLLEMSDVPRPSPNGPEAGEKPPSPAAEPAPMWRPGFSGRAAAAGVAGPWAASTWHRRVLWIAVAGLALLIAVGVVALLLRPASNRIREQPASEAPAFVPSPVPPDPPIAERPAPPEGARDPASPFQPSVLDAPAAADGETPELTRGETSTTVAPVPTVAPAPAPPSRRPPSGEKAAPVKEVSAPAKKVHERAGGKWIQTR